MKSKFLYLLLCILFAKPLLAQDDAVMLAENCLYIGAKSYLNPGTYRANQLGIRNDRLSAFHLPSGMALQVFEGDNYTGPSETFYSSVLCLPANWRNKVSSVKVYWVHDPGNGGGNGDGDSGNNLPPQGDRVIFYRDMRYSGMSRAVVEGNFGSGSLGFLTDNVSSIYIPYGISVQVNDKQGRKQIFHVSVANLAQYGWDDKINSGFIQKDNGNGGGVTLPPQGDQVIFYADMKYTGASTAINPGNFSPDMLGNLIENVSSIYIPAGQTVRVHDRQNRNRTFTISQSNLAQLGWDNKIYTGFIGGTNNTLPPQGNQVIFYRDNQYSGFGKPLTPGNFSAATLNSLGLTNNISSIYIPWGHSVMVYDLQNRVQTFTSSIANLGQYGWDNRISTGTISSGGSQGGNQGGNQAVVNLYADANYQGKVIPCAEGRKNSLGFGANISSIQIPRGFAVIVYQEPNFAGSSKTFTSSVSNLASYFGWNDRINSIYVYRQ